MPSWKRNRSFFKLVFLNFYLLIFRKRHQFVIHWLILVCALTGDWTHNLGVPGWCSNQMSHPDRVGEPTLNTLAYIPKSGHANSYGNSIFNYFRAVIVFFTTSVPFYFPAHQETVQKISNLSTSSSLVFCCFFFFL